MHVLSAFVEPVLRVVLSRTPKTSSAISSRARESLRDDTVVDSLF